MNMREVQYYVKKGIMWLADEVEAYLLMSGRSFNNPLVMQAGVVVLQKTNQIRDALYNRSDLEYLDKKIKEECNHRIKRKEYSMMSDVEREKVDASWRQNRWKEAGLDGMRKRLGIDAVIDKNEVEVILSDRKEYYQDTGKILNNTPAQYKQDQLFCAEYSKIFAISGRCDS